MLAWKVRESVRGCGVTCPPTTTENMMTTKLHNLVPRVTRPKLKFRACGRGADDRCVFEAHPDGRTEFKIERYGNGYRLLGSGLSCFDQGAQRWGFAQTYRSLDAAKLDAERLIRLDCERSRVKIGINWKGEVNETLATYRRMGVRVLAGVGQKSKQK